MTELEKERIKKRAKFIEDYGPVITTLGSMLYSQLIKELPIESVVERSPALAGFCLTSAEIYYMTAGEYVAEAFFAAHQLDKSDDTKH